MDERLDRTLGLYVTEPTPKDDGIAPQSFGSDLSLSTSFDDEIGKLARDAAFVPKQDIGSGFRSFECRVVGAFRACRNDIPG